MIINRHNYEVFLIDYLDGKLSPSVIAELMMFLDKNPDIKEELDGLQDAILVGETAAFPNKSNLKKKSFLKNGIDNEFEYLCIASIEGAITKEEETALINFLADNKVKQKEFQTFSRSSIEVNKTITFPNKSQLKRTSIIPIRYSTFRKAVAIAASIALLIGVYSIGKFFVFDNSNSEITKTNIIASSDSPNKAIKTENRNNIKSENKIKTLKIISKAETKSEPIKESADLENTRTRIPESIPSKITRIEPKQFSIICNPQFDQLLLIAATYSTSYQYTYEHYYAQQETNLNGSKTKEIGVFEIIQYGVQTFGKFIGKDIHLNAKKDKNGNIEKISFESNLVAFSTPIKRKE